MSKVEVRNLDHREYVEMFRDEEIRIPAGGSVEMGRAEAITFLSQASSMKRDGQGRALNPKRLEIYQDPEKHAEDRGQPPRFPAPGGENFRTQAGYDNYMEKLASETAEASIEKALDEKEQTDGRPRRRKRAES